MGIALIVLGVAILMIQSTIAKNFRDLDAAMGKPVQAESHTGGNWGSALLCSVALFSGSMILFGKVGKLKILGKVETLQK